jgi:peptidoglycan/LPS O-acetylase OafA/YrhL
MAGKLTPPDKLLGLEALRFIAAFSVLIWHYQHFAYIAGAPVDLVRDRLPLYGLLQPFYETGRYGVWVFWCVSGFIFFWKYRDAIFERSMPGWKFFVFRLSRLYPLHFVTLIIVAILQSIYFRWQGYFFVYQDNDIQHFLLQIFMASKWGLESGDSFNGPIWSISVEVLVYVIFFLMLRFVTRSALLNLVVILVCLNISGQVFSCLAFFYAGGLAAIARRAIASATFRGAIERVGWLAAVLVPVVTWMFRSQYQVIDWVFFLTYTPHSSVLPFLQDHPSGNGAKIPGGRRKHDLFKLSRAFSNSAFDRAGVRDFWKPNSVLRCLVFRTVRRLNAADIVSCVSLFRSAGPGAPSRSFVAESTNRRSGQRNGVDA